MTNDKCLMSNDKDLRKMTNDKCLMSNRILLLVDGTLSLVGYRHLWIHNTLEIL